LSKAIEDTIKTLTEFESELHGVTMEAVESKKRLIKSAGEWAEAAGIETLDKAQKQAEQKLAEARLEAEKEVESIRGTGQASLQNLRETIARHEEEAVHLTMKRLLGVEL
jgi:vacuolar-type H+-ATPase subunit H